MISFKKFMAILMFTLFVFGAVSVIGSSAVLAKPNRHPGPPPSHRRVEDLYECRNCHKRIEVPEGRKPLKGECPAFGHRHHNWRFMGRR